METNIQAWVTFLNDVLSVNGNGRTKIPYVNSRSSFDALEIFFESRGLDVLDLRGSDELPGWIAGRLELPEGTTFEDLARHIMLHGIVTELRHAGANYEDDDDDDE